MVSLKDDQLMMKNLSCKIQGGESNTKNRGGWITLRFIIGSTMGLTLAAGSWYANLTDFLIQEYNMSDVVANRIYNIINIGVNLLPVLGALVADSCVGSFLVINVASFASLVGLMMLGLPTTIIPSLRPSHTCNNNITSLLTNTTNCQLSPSTHQYAFLFAALILAGFGFGCTRFMLGSLRAYQFDKPEHRRIFFNVYILAYEVCWAISTFLSIFTYQERVMAWKISLGIGIFGNVISIALFLSGSRYYRHVIPQHDNMIMSMTRVLGFLSFTVRKLFATCNAKSSSSVYNDEYPSLEIVHEVVLPSKRFEGKSSYPLDTTQVNDMKRLIKVTPIWSSGILLNAAVATSTTLVVLQASSMNSTVIRPHFHLPAASIPTVSLVFTALALSIFDYVLYPAWHNIIGRPLKPLQRSGVGHVFVILGLIGLALVEVGHRYHLKIISAWWLVFPLALLGTGAAFYFPGVLTFHYQEFPKSLKSTSTAVPSVQVVIGFFLSKGFVNVVKHKTSWLLMNGDNVGLGRLDLVYGVLAIIVGVNFGYFLVCAHFYKYNDIEDESDGAPTQPQPQP